MYKNFKIFDTLAHPTVNGKWLRELNGETFEDFSKKMHDYNLIGACVVGLPGIGGYSHEKFYKLSIQYNNMYPVAALTGSNIDEMIKEINIIYEIGFKFIKIHPRLLKYDFKEDELSRIFIHCQNLNIIIFYCTYYFSKINIFPSKDPYWTLVNSLKNAPDLKIVLLHGGGVRILEYSELCRHNKNILLDLSLTITKYNNSSIDQNIRFLFKYFDQKICIGSDHPEWSYPELFEKLMIFSKDISSEKMKNIFYHNIQNFIF